MSRNNNFNNNPPSKPSSYQGLSSNNNQSLQQSQQASFYSGLNNQAPQQIPQRVPQQLLSSSIPNNQLFQQQQQQQLPQQQMQFPARNNTTNINNNQSLFGNLQANPGAMQNNFAQNYQQQMFNDQSRAFIQSSIPQQSNSFPIPLQMNNQFPQPLFAPQNNFNPLSIFSHNVNPFSEVPMNKNDYFGPNDGEEELGDTTMVTQIEKDTNFDLDQITKLSMKLKKKFVQSSSFQEQTFPMLVSLAVDNLETAKKTPIDLVCVIDHSGSMSGDKIELVKKTFNYLLEYLDESDRLSIVIFDDRASRLVPLVRTTAENKKKILNTLKTFGARGGTDINLGMKTAFDVLKQRKYFNPVSSIFLLSDGQDNGAQHRVKESLEKNRISEDITVNTFGFGRDHDPQLMTDIANLRDGNFYFISKLDTVDEAFVDCLGGLINAVAQNVEIRIKPEQSGTLLGVDIVKAYGDTSMWNYDSSSHTYTTKMATLFSGKQKDYVLEIKLPLNKKELADHEKSIKIASAEAVITGLDNKVIVKKVDLTITLLNEVEEVKDEGEEDDREVMKNFYRVKGAQLMDEARKLADSRRYDEAQKILKNFKEEVGNSFLKEEEFIKNLITDIMSAIQDVSPVTYESIGKQNMISNQRAQMQQRSNISSANCYQIQAQACMTTQVKTMKGQQDPFC